MEDVGRYAAVPADRFSPRTIPPGGGSTVAALLQIAASGVVPAAETIFFVSSLLLTLWTLTLGILMWRDPADTTADALSLVSAAVDLRR